LLLIAQHFQSGLAQHGEIERWFLRRRVREADLMRQRGFAAPGRAGYDVKGKLRQAAAENIVQARHAGRQFPDCDFGELAHWFSTQFAFVLNRMGLHFLSPLSQNQYRWRTASATHREPDAT
jgi:hypothetical protein